MQHIGVASTIGGIYGCYTLVRCHLIWNTHLISEPAAFRITAWEVHSLLPYQETWFSEHVPVRLRYSYLLLKMPSTRLVSHPIVLMGLYPIYLRYTSSYPGFTVVARGWMRKGMRTKLEASLVSVTTKIYLVSQTPVFWRNTFFGAGLFSWMLDVLSLSARYRKELPLLLSGGRLLLVCTWISDSGIFAMSILSEGKDLNH